MCDLNLTKWFRTRDILEVVRLNEIHKRERGDDGGIKIEKALHLGDRIQKRKVRRGGIRETLRYMRTEDRVSSVKVCEHCRAMSRGTRKVTKFGS